MHLIQIKSQGWSATKWLEWFEQRSGATWDLDAIENILDEDEFYPTHGVSRTLAVLDGNTIPEEERFVEPILRYADQTGLNNISLEAMFLAIASGKIPNALPRGTFGVVRENEIGAVHLYLRTSSLEDVERVVASNPGLGHCFPSSTVFLFGVNTA